MGGWDPRVSPSSGGGGLGGPFLHRSVSRCACVKFILIIVNILMIFVHFLLFVTYVSYYYVRLYLFAVKVRARRFVLVDAAVVQTAIAS